MDATASSFAATAEKKITHTGQQQAQVHLLELGDAIDSYRTGLDALARRSAEPNPFFEAGPLSLAHQMLRGLDQTKALVVQDHSTSSVIGFLPVKVERLFPKLPFEGLRTSNHLFCFGHVPLIAKDKLELAVNAIINWFSHEASMPIDLAGLNRHGPLWQALRSAAADKGCPSLEHHVRSRASFGRATSAQSYLTRALVKKKRKEFARQRRRLGDEGRLEVRFSHPSGSDAVCQGNWIDAFLQLEQTGWKGDAGTALLSQSEHSLFFRKLIEERTSLGLCQWAGLFLDERPVALKVNLLGQGHAGHAFAFKIAYDEAFEKFSPGVLLELEQINLMHQADCMIETMDSCATPDHSMINRLWTERIELADLMLLPGNLKGKLLGRALKLGQTLHRRNHDRQQDQV